MSQTYPNLEQLSQFLVETKDFKLSCAEYTGQDEDYWYYKITGVVCCIWILSWENGFPVAGSKFNLTHGDTFSVAKKDQTWMPC